MQLKQPFKSYKIAVVGGGTAGPAAALFLQRQGHQVTLFEQVPVLAPVGAGILLQPSGLAVLKQLRLLEPILEYAAPVDRLHSETRKGLTLLDLYYKELDPCLSGRGIHRAVLAHFLFEALKKEGVEIVLGASVEAWIGDKGPCFGPVSLKIAGENPAHKLYEQKFYDALILADGARSKLQRMFSKTRRVREYPWGALWCIGPEVPGPWQNCLWQKVGSCQEMLGFLPTGLSLEEKKPLLSFFWSLPVSEKDRFYEKPLQDWKREVSALAPEAAVFLDSIQSHKQLTLAVYHDVVMSEWHDFSVVVIGDAAHAMSPQLGQGANLGLCDAAALDLCFREQPLFIERALALYSQKRRFPLRFYQFVTRALTPLFQSKLPLATLRNVAFRGLSSFSPFKKQMIRTMAGLKRGFLRRSVNLDP